MSRPLVFLHLSDIHFCRFSNGNYDPDLDVRKQLVRDAKHLRSRLGVCSGILVTGDIASSGKKSEYETAQEWLAHLCHELDCESDSVWTVPGNHDVDREIVARSTTIQDRHARIRQGDPESEIQRLHHDPEALQIIRRPLANYEFFAGHFGLVPPKEITYWDDQLPLNDGSALRLRGVNSALISARDDENANRLAVGLVPITMPEDDGVTNLLLCHHPPSWLLDRDRVIDLLESRIHISLFGHKHQQRIQFVNNSLRIMAGAVHPDRREGEWKPRYNYLAIDVRNETSRTLHVQVWPRIWDGTARFVAEYSDVGNEVSDYDIKLPSWTPPPAVSVEPPWPHFTAATVKEGRIVNPMRHLIYRFCGLPFVKQVAIVSRLRLVEEEDVHLTNLERQKQYFIRASDRNVLAALWDAVEQARGVDLPGSNPFVDTH